MNNLVAIVGRPNVGKSSFFNRLTESRTAIVDDQSGVTRDRHYGVADWIGYTFNIIDTGGYVAHSADVFEVAVREQVELSIEEAQVILFMVDVTVGITDLEDRIALLLRKSGKSVFVVVNKVDNNALLTQISTFYSLGLGELYPVSSMTGSGTGELLDEVVKKLEKTTADEEEVSIPKYAIVGKPNVGKSSLINALLGTPRNIVTPIAGTTRDAIHIHYKQFGHEFLLIDTAGLRRKTKVKENIEFYSVMRTIRALEEADVCLLMLDAREGLEAQDINIFHLAEKNKKGIVIVVNKWDLVEKDQHSTKTYTESIKERIAPFTDVPIIFTSVPEGQRLLKAVEAAEQVYSNRAQKIPTSKLNDLLLEAIERYPPPAIKGKNVKIKYVTQVGGVAPAFVFFCNSPQYVKEPYKRYLENKLRENFKLSGVPIILFFREK